MLLVPIGMFGLTVNVTANTSVQMATDPAMRGRVMGLYMMVFIGGTPVGAPIVGWITDTYGARVGMAVGGVSPWPPPCGRRGRWPASAACGCVPTGTPATRASTSSSRSTARQLESRRRHGGAAGAGSASVA